MNSRQSQGTRSVYAFALLILSCIATSSQADITPLSSKLKASSVADVDPDTVPNVPDAKEDSTPDGHLRSLGVATGVHDAVPPDLTEFVSTTASVRYVGNDTAIITFIGGRSGSDPTLGPPGGEFASVASFDLAFQNLAAGTLNVDWVLGFTRPNTGTFTPLGIGLQRGAFFDSRGPSVPFDAKSASDMRGTESFTLDRTGIAGLYTLELDLSMVGRTTDLNQLENWNVTFTVHTPAMTITPVPEPSIPAALVLGVGAAVWTIRRRYRLG
jgi:hypothetical protein